MNKAAKNKSAQAEKFINNIGEFIMKNLLLYGIAIMLLLSGCTTWNYKAIKLEGIVLWDKVELYERNATGTIGAITSYTMEGRKNSYIDILGILRKKEIAVDDPLYVLIEYNEKEYFAPIHQVAPVEYRRMATIKIDELRIPKEKDAEHWSRAIYYVNKHSSMKIQTQTEYMISTFNPITIGQKGFNISKRIEDAEVIYSIEVPVRGPNVVFNSIRDAKRCGYYILYGKAYSLD